MQSATVNFQQVWSQQAIAAERFILDSAQLVSFPQPFSASASFATAQTPWYLDYGHLTFWFFFFAAFVIVLWLCYLCWALTRGTEQRRVVRETRGYSRAQTGDTLTAVLPLTWSVTMLAHAGTHSANFDENTNATLFSFTVIAYQWGWNYFFPREIAELLTGAPRLVGHGRLLEGTPHDPYSRLLARARRDYLAQLHGLGQFSAKHGRFVASGALALTLPSLPTYESTLPEWAVLGVVPVSNPSGSVVETSPAVGHTSRLEVSREAYLTALPRRPSKSRSVEPLLSSRGGGSTANPSLRIGTGVAFSLANFSEDLAPMAAVTQGFRTPVSGVMVGNRLAHVHAHLASTVAKTSGASQRQTALLIGRLLQADRTTKLTLGVESLIRQSAVSALTLANVQPLLGGRRLAVGLNERGWVNALRLDGLTSRLSTGFLPPFQSYLLGGLGSGARPGVAFPLLNFWQVGLRGTSTGLLGGDGTSLSSADGRANTAASASEAAIVAPCGSAAPLWAAQFLAPLELKLSHLPNVSLGGRLGLASALVSLNGGWGANFSPLLPYSNPMVGLVGSVDVGQPACAVRQIRYLVSNQFGSPCANPHAPRYALHPAFPATVKVVTAGYPQVLGAQVLGYLRYEVLLGTAGLPVSQPAEVCISPLSLSDLLRPFSRKGSVFSLLGRSDVAPARSEHLLWEVTLAPYLGSLTRPSLFLSTTASVWHHLSQYSQCWSYLTSAQLVTVAPVMAVSFGLVTPEAGGFVDGVFLEQRLFWRAAGLIDAVRPPLYTQFPVRPLGGNAVPGFEFPVLTVRLHCNPAFTLAGLATGVYGCGSAEVCVARSSIDVSLASLLSPSVGWLFFTLGLSFTDLSSLAPLFASLQVTGLGLVASADPLMFRCSNPLLVEGAIVELFFVYVGAWIRHVSVPLVSACGSLVLVLVSLQGWLKAQACGVLGWQYWSTDAWLYCVRASVLLTLPRSAWGSVFQYETAIVSVREVSLELVKSGYPLWQLFHVAARLSERSEWETYALLLQGRTPGWVEVWRSCGSAVGALLKPGARASLRLGDQPTASSAPTRGLTQIPDLQLVQNAQVAAMGGVYPAERVFGSAGGVQVVGSQEGFTSLPHVSWLGGPSETQPVRVATVIEGDLLQVNARPGAVVSAAVAHLDGPLAAWRSLWSWQTAAAAFPRDRNFRAQLVRRPWTGLGPGKLVEASTAAQAGEFLALQRQRFDKNAGAQLIPRLRNLQVRPAPLELGRAVLDAERGGFLPLFASVLPLPYVDIDPSFINTRWANELNTSRRSDHDARFRVTWGPLAALWSKGETQLGASTTWTLASGPAVANALATRTWRELSLLAQNDLAAVTARVTPFNLRLSPNIHTLSAGPVVTPVGMAGPAVLQRSAQGSLSYAAGLVRHSNVATSSPLGRAAGNLQLGPWGMLWALSGHHAALGGYLGTVGGADTTQFWLVRLVSQLEAYREGVAVQVQAAGVTGEIALPAASSHPLVSLMRQVSEPLAGFQGLTSQAVGARPTRAGYQPIAADIGSQRRLRVTKGIYLPADVPMHGIFGSKDVIHSWAIPGLGVKIDCIPGYSSHRRLVFRWRGLYWGQCMEVCGRYHHWMPILVRVVQKDVFLVWCLAYLRLLTAHTAAGVVVPSVEGARTVWAVAEAVRGGAH